MPEEPGGGGGRETDCEEGAALKRSGGVKDLRSTAPEKTDAEKILWQSGGDRHAPKQPDERIHSIAIENLSTPLTLGKAVPTTTVRKLTISGKTGIVTGTIVDPLTVKPIPLKGVYLPKSKRVWGILKSAMTGGRIEADVVVPQAAVMKPIIALLLLAGPVFCAEYHVATTGADDAVGTVAAPWRTVQRAADAVRAGDTVLIHEGTYVERVSLDNRDGTAAAPIVFRSAPGETAVISQLGVTPPDGESAVFSIRDCDHITLLGLTIRDYKTASKEKMPVGISVSGGGTGVALRECKVTHIWQSFPGLNDFDANAHGIAVYGDSAKAISGLVIDGCEVSDLRLGASEAVVLNGNVTRFQVTNNRVHDCNNIGIDFIGYEGVNRSPALDRARFGRCAGNVVWNIDAKFNPVYGGNFETGGDSTTQSAPGIYVDGGSDIVIEQNHVFSCNFALSVGSEQPRRRSARVKVRNNIFHHCHVGGIVIGGEDTANSGGTSACSFTNNTVWDNDLAGAGGGQFMVQHFVTGTSIKRNIIGATAGFTQLILKENTTGSFSRNSVNWNLYFAPPSASVEFIWNGVSFSSFEEWKQSGSTTKDSSSRLITGGPGFVNATPDVLSPASDFRIVAESHARDSGDSAAARFRPATGERDFFEGPRVINKRVDVGAHEFVPVE